MGGEGDRRGSCQRDHCRAEHAECDSGSRGDGVLAQRGESLREAIVMCNPGLSRGHLTPGQRIVMPERAAINRLGSGR